FRASLPNAKPLVEKVSADVPTPVPVPAMSTVWLPPAAVLLEATRVPAHKPGCVGLKDTLTVQVAASARVAGQLLVSEKSPLALTPESVNGWSPMLERVTVCTALVVP